MTDLKHWQQDSPRWQLNRASFDQVADLYDAFRPGYPVEMVDFVVSASRLPYDGQILEIGCGTGKATRLFAAWGYSMTCVEPGAKLAAVARERLEPGQKVVFEISRFEDWQDRDRKFDLVLSAQSFHWIPVEIAYRKSASLLNSGSSLALIWNMYPDTKEPPWDEMDAIYDQYWPYAAKEPITYLELVARREREIIESGFFKPPQICVFPWSETYTTESYLGLLSTYSDHIALKPEQRQKLFSAIGDLIDSNGGQIEKPYMAYAYVAQKRSSPCSGSE